LAGRRLPMAGFPTQVANGGFLATPSHYVRGVRCGYLPSLRSPIPGVNMEKYGVRGVFYWGMFP
jgi:hypothetical protein